MEIRSIDSIHEGDSVSLDFLVTAEDMDTFLRLSGDTSLSHTNEDFCHKTGFDGRVVYGGLLLARLSGLLGTLIPGATGLSTQWSVTFRRPLYVGVPARIEATVTDVSPATKMIQLAFWIRADERRLATGRVQTLVLDAPS